MLLGVNAIQPPVRILQSNYLDNLIHEISQFSAT